MGGLVYFVFIIRRLYRLHETTQTSLGDNLTELPADAWAQKFEQDEIYKIADALKRFRGDAEPSCDMRSGEKSVYNMMHIHIKEASVSNHAQMRLI
jgi:hypothetical protein